jgi:hypothetical protein
LRSTMSQRYDTESTRMRGRERPREEYGRFEPESERYEGREGQRFQEDEYPSRYDGGSSEFGRGSMERGRNRYEPERYGGFDRERESGRFGEQYDEGNRRSSERQWRGSEMSRYGGYGNEQERQRFSEPSRNQYSQHGRFGESSYGRQGSSGMGNRSESMFGGGGGYVGAGYVGTGYSGGYGGDGGWQPEHQQGQATQSRESFAGRGPKGYRRSDERIEEDVNEALSQDPRIDATEIEVKVTNGEVTLSGTVDNRSIKRMAEDVAERCAGVHDVKNEIRDQREQESGGHQQAKGKPATSVGSSKTTESKTA